MTKIAYSVISQYNDAVATEAKNIALTTQKTEIEQINAVLEQIELSKTNLEHQKEQLGKRPMFLVGNEMLQMQKFKSNGKNWTVRNEI